MHYMCLEGHLQRLLTKGERPAINMGDTIPQAGDPDKVKGKEGSTLPQAFSLPACEMSSGNRTLQNWTRYHWRLHFIHALIL
jgi:hypothetical protein